MACVLKTGRRHLCIRGCCGDICFPFKAMCTTYFVPTANQFLSFHYPAYVTLQSPFMAALAMHLPVIGARRMQCGPRNLTLHATASTEASRSGDSGFPSFLPKEVDKIKDPCARTLARRIQRLPVQIGCSESCIMSSCVKPIRQGETNPVVLLHCFDSSCLEWRCTYPLLEEAGLEVWAVDVLGWGFSDLGMAVRFTCPCLSEFSPLPHFYTPNGKLWKSHIKKPMILVGPSLGGAVAIDFAVNYPEAVKQLVLINASVYAEGTGPLAKLPRIMAYAAVSFLKSLPVRLSASVLFFNNIPLTTRLNWTKVSRLHCLLPWWEDATVNYMLSGGYNVVAQIKQVKQKALVIWGEQDNIISSKLAIRLHSELPNSIIRQVQDCGHCPQLEKPSAVAKLIIDFVRSSGC